MTFFARSFVAALAFAGSLAVVGVARADEPAVVIVPAPQPLKARTVLVHIDSPARVALEERVEKRTYRVVCEAPCDRELPLDATYRIRGDSVRNSGDFRLAGQAGERITLTVDPSARGTFTAGLVTTSIGGGVMLLGLTYGMVAGLGNIDICYGGCSDERIARRHERGVEIERTTAIIAGVGLAGVLIGLPVMLGNRRSDVGQESADAPRDPSRPPPEAFIRVPPPRERETVAVSGPSFVVPMSFTF